MAHIQTRKNSKGGTTYRVQVRLKGQPTQSATFARITDAKKWAAATEAAIREGRHFKTTEAKRHTLAELIDRYVREILPDKAPSTQAAQARQLRWWRDKLGAYSLADITPAQLSEHKVLLQQELVPSPVRRGRPAAKRTTPDRPRGPATAVRYMAALSHAFTIAVKEWGWLEHNPMARVSKPREPKGRVRYLSKDELTRLLAALDASSNPDLKPAVVLALCTGARRMEVMGLRWKQVDLERQLIVLVETKNGERRSIPLAGPALRLICERANAKGSDTDLVFARKSNPTKPIDLTASFKAALNAADITDFRWHDLRHTAASYLAMNGAGPAEIAEVLGHKTLQMVKRYSHLSTEHVVKVVTRMNDAIFGQTS